MARVTKDSAVERKLRAVEDELSALKKGMKSLSKEMGRRRLEDEDPFAETPAPVEPPTPVAPPKPAPREDLEIPTERQPAAPVPTAIPATDDTAQRPRAGRPSPTPERIREGRFADYYIANSYRSNRPLRHEMKIQRARALFMLACALLGLAWFLYMWGPTIAALIAGDVPAGKP